MTTDDLLIASLIRCAHGVDSATFSDLLALLAEALYMPHGFSESVRALPRMLADCAADAR